MEFSTAKALIVMDHEGRERLGTYFEGDRVQIVDYKGRERRGEIIKIYGSAVLIRNKCGAEITIGYRGIDSVREAAEL